MSDQIPVYFVNGLREGGVLEKYFALPPAQRRDHLKLVDEATTQEEREQRIQEVVERLQ